MKTLSCFKAFAVVLALIGSSFLLLAETPSTNVVEKTKTCFQCNGAGKTKCPVPSCKNGQADCPAPCLKLSRGTWVHMTVDGHGPNELWQRFPGRGGRVMSWNQSHVGDVIQMQNGDPVNIGKCTVCGGTTRVKCAVCKGAGEIACPICGGKKVVPESWTIFDNPKMKDRPSLFKLKDGSTLIGHKRMVVDKTATIRTEKGDIQVPTEDILTEEKQATRK